MSRILLADDHELVRSVTANRLREAGLQVTDVRCSEAEGATGPFDVAVVQLGKGRHGIDVARRLAATGRVRSVLFWTGSTDQALLAEAWRVGEVFSKLDGVAMLERALSAAGTRRTPRSSVRATEPGGRTHGMWPDLHKAATGGDADEIGPSSGQGRSSR